MPWEIGGSIAYDRMLRYPDRSDWYFVKIVLVGEVLEWTIRRAWRARVALGDRGFESHPLRFFYLPYLAG